MNDLKGFPTFAQFLNAVSGYGPYPWQQRLADYVVENGYFPDAVTVPTGLGKTTSMLVHLYALARDVHLNGPRGRKIPLRCFLIVERRVVVDTSAEVAEEAASEVAHSAEPMVVRGDPGRAICEVAEEQGSELIILGTHDRSAFGRLWFGSVSDHVVHHAPCPVLVVRS